MIIIIKMMVNIMQVMRKKVDDDNGNGNDVNDLDDGVLEVNLNMMVIMTLVVILLCKYKILKSTTLYL